MNPAEAGAAAKLIAAGVVGFVFQWAMFAPKKVPSWVAWLALGVVTLLVYWWVTPTMTSDFKENWRLSIFGVVSFFLTARGTGATARSANIAPAANSLGRR